VTIERDTRFPVRVTVQFYQATSNGTVSQADVGWTTAQIDKAYGWRTTGFAGRSGSPRSTSTHRLERRAQHHHHFSRLAERQLRFGWWQVAPPVTR
jgi:hypothetical protein